MLDAGAFADFIETQLTTKVRQPNSRNRPTFPYISMVGLVSNQQQPHMRGRVIVSDSSGDSEEIFKPRHSQFSMTAIGDPDTTEAEDLAQSLHDLLDKQATEDFLAARKEALLIVGEPAARFIVEDNFNEARWGFDIEIRDTRKVIEISKDVIDTVKVSDTSSKVPDIEVPIP